MLTRLTIRNFKLFGEVEIELAERVVFVGPNNSGKTSALQALGLWSAGVRRWIEKRGEGRVPRDRAGVTINRRDLIAVPVPAANLLWRDLHTREGYLDGEKRKTRNLVIEVDVEGTDDGREWAARLEFDYANEESIYCRSRIGPGGSRLDVPRAAAGVRLAFLPPMSGLVANERLLQQGAVDVAIGEGRTAEVLRNLCWQVFQRDTEAWKRIARRINGLFGARMDDPQFIAERGEIAMTYRTLGGTRLDLSASGRGQQQTLLLLAHMAANPGSVMLLDEPDAHLEILRQRQIYQVLTETARETGSQILAASHSEVILNEAAGRDRVVAFVGKPHAIGDRIGQVIKSLAEYGFEHYLQAEVTGWVLYLEGSTDLAILRGFARTVSHPVEADLERPFVQYVANQPSRARAHFHGVREAKPDLVGVAVYDRLTTPLATGPDLVEHMWRRREIENYLCQESTLLDWAESEGRRQVGELSASEWRHAMRLSIAEIVSALAELGKGDPWSHDLKASDDFLDPLFRKFFGRLALPNRMPKTNYHELAPFVPAEDMDDEVREKLDAIHAVASRARPRGAGG